MLAPSHVTTPVAGQAVVPRMAHRDKAIAAAATTAVRALLGSEAVAGSMDRDAVRSAVRLFQGAWVLGQAAHCHVRKAPRPSACVRTGAMRLMRGPDSKGSFLARIMHCSGDMHLTGSLHRDDLCKAIA